MNGRGVAAEPDSIPELDFRIGDAYAQEYAAVPTIVFRLAVESLGGHAVRSALLDTQIQIAARARPYDAEDADGLADIFGTPERWGTTLRTLLWTRTTRVVPAFEGATVVDLPVACSYDLDVIASRYFGGIGGGGVPLEFLFSGTVFYTGAGGMLQTSRISWEKEATYSLPVSVWRETMDRHFPGTAWLRVSKGTYDRLTEERARRGEADFEGTLGALLEEKS
jgi:Family of unknown function (DUF6084)